MDKVNANAFPVGFNDNIYHEVTFPKCSILMYLHFQSLENVNLDLMVNGKRAMRRNETFFLMI